LKKILLDVKVNVNEKDKYEKTALMYASENGHCEIVKLLIINGADINIQDKGKLIALDMASMKRHIETMNVLSDIKNDHSINENKGIAFIYAFKKAVKILLNENVDVNIKDANGQTVLMYVSGNGYNEAVKMLLNENVDINIKDANGQTVLMFAIENRNIKTANILLKANADVRITME
jgi:ankyrin repeat protein